MTKETTQHRIGAVSTLSGVPVPTLRVWESRYAAFAPGKTAGQHRLYSDDDVLRATLLRQLTGAGHAISTLARLDAAQLGARLQAQRGSQWQRGATLQGPRSVSMVVVGLPLATRVQSARFLDALPGVAVRLTETLAELSDAPAQDLREPPDLLLVRVGSLHMATHTAVRRLVALYRVPHTIVLYNFGQQRVVEAMKAEGLIVRREPLADTELAELVRALLLVDPRAPTHAADVGALIPPRRYSDQTLARVAAIASKVLCECPRHVAELITQLASFEQYSQDCLNNSVEDARLHAQLSAISGSARALFEQALEMVAAHEGIALD